MKAGFVDSNLRFVLLPPKVKELGHGQQVNGAYVQAHDLLALSTSMYNGLPGAFTPGFHNALDWEALSLSPNASDESINQTIGKLNEWLSQDRPYRSADSGQALTRACAVVLKEESQFPEEKKNQAVGNMRKRLSAHELEGASKNHAIWVVRHV